MDGIHVRIQEKGRPISEIIKVFQNKIPSNVKMSGIKKIILKHLQMYINSQRKRGVEKHTMYGEKEGFRYTLENNLYNTIEAGTTLKEAKTGDGHYKYELGIGEKKFLQTFARYWKVVNYGGYVPPPTLGYFGNGKGPNGTGRDVFHNVPYWKGTNPYPRNHNSFLMVPKKPITGMHYIEEMAKVMEIELALIRAQFNQR
jgi:hypothetical protein